MDKPKKTDKEIMWDKLKFVPVAMDAGFFYCPYVTITIISTSVDLALGTYEKDKEE